MSIATRVTLLTVLLVGLTLSLYGFLSLRSRRVEVTADLERQTRLFGSALAVSLEAGAIDVISPDPLPDAPATQSCVPAEQALKPKLHPASPPSPPPRRALARVRERG